MTDTTRVVGVSEALDRAARIGKALSDPGRLRILAAVERREMCVCHLVDLLGLDQSTVSRHVRLLRDAGLIAVRKDGRWLHCRRAEGMPALWAAIDALLATAPEVRHDAQTIDPGTCC